MRSLQRLSPAGRPCAALLDRSCWRNSCQTRQSELCGCCRRCLPCFGQGLSQLKISCVNAVGYWVFIENGNQIFIDPRTIFWTVTDEKIVALHNSFFKVTRSMWWIGALFLYKEVRSYRNRHKDDCWWNNDDRQDPTPATGRRGIFGGYKPCGRSWNVIWSSYGQVPVAANSGNLISTD